MNYDIHWNPVRIVQRFGRVDRIGSRNKFIQLVNFWPDMELDDYINLKSRVETRMKISIMTSTGDDNLINEEEKGDLEYRKQLTIERMSCSPDIVHLCVSAVIIAYVFTFQSSRTFGADGILNLIGSVFKNIHQFVLTEAASARKKTVLGLPEALVSGKRDRISSIMAGASAAEQVLPGRSHVPTSIRVLDSLIRNGW